MTARRTRGFDPDSFPALAQFAAGYLHEDFAAEHGTAKGAREAFLRDASARERGAFGREALRFVAEISDMSWADARGAFAALGGAWQPASRAALVALFEPPTPHTSATRRRSTR